MMIIDINKNLIPYAFDIELDKVYTLTIQYNKEYDFFTVDLSLDDKMVVEGDKIVYGRALFSHLRHLDIPSIPIVPLEIADSETRVTWDNLGEKVFLYLGDTDG